MEVRRVRDGEYVELRRVRLESLAYAPRLQSHMERERAAPERFGRARATGGAAGTRRATFVAVKQGEFVGLVDGFLSDTGDVVEVGGMWVAPAERRAGVGRQLLDAVVAWARDRGASRVALWVRRSNTPARLLYENYGFEHASPSNHKEAGLRFELRV